QCELVGGQVHHVERVHDRPCCRQSVGGGGVVAGEPVHRHDLDSAAEVRVLGAQPVGEHRDGSAGHHVEQAGWAGAVDDRSQIDDDGHEIGLALPAAVFPLVFINTQIANTVEVASTVEDQFTSEF